MIIFVTTDSVVIELNGRFGDLWPTCTGFTEKKYCWLPGGIEFMILRALKRTRQRPGDYESNKLCNTIF